MPHLLSLRSNRLRSHRPTLATARDTTPPPQWTGEEPGVQKAVCALVQVRPYSHMWRQQQQQQQRSELKTHSKYYTNTYDSILKHSIVVYIMLSTTWNTTTEGVLLERHCEAIFLCIDTYILIKWIWGHPMVNQCQYYPRASLRRAASRATCAL